MRRWLWLLPLLTVAAIFAIRVTGPPDFLDKDQGRPIDYIVDAVANGHWVVQRDAGGDITSKPPVFTWLASLSTLAFGPGRFALYLPCALAMAALVMLAFRLARHRLGLTAGLASAMALVLAIDTQKAIVLARTDAVFAATVALAAWLALTAWERGRGWWMFWAFCGVVSIAKSPAGILFAAGGLLAVWWCRRDQTSPRAAPGGWRPHAVGVGLLLFIAGGWFAWAVLSQGQPVVDKLLGRELVGHVVANDKGAPLWKTLPQPLVWFFGLFMPWAVATLVALWRLVRHPPISPRRRRFLRFMACWLLVGIAALCLAPHKRMILSLPMLLPAAILAGSEIARLLGRISLSRQLALWLLLASGTVAGLLLYHHRLRDESGDRIAESRALLVTADALQAWQRRGADVRWSGLPSTLRYFVPGHPSAIPASGVQAFLDQAGPGVVAVPAGGTGPGVRMLIAPGIDILIDRDAQALLR